MKRAIVLFLALAFALLVAAGCAGTRAVYVPYGEPVRIGRPTPTWVWAADKDGKEQLVRMTLPEGWYALPRTERIPTP